MAIVAFILSLAVVIYMTSRKFVPAFCLFIGAIVAAIFSGLPLGSIATTLNKSFGSILISAGLLILFAFIYTQYLKESGGITELAKSLIRVSGFKYDLVAFALVSYIVSIPIGILPTVAILAPMIKPMSRLTKRPVPAYTCAFIIPALLTATTVVPCHGPIIVGGMIGINLGWYMFWGIILTLPLAVVSTLLSYWISKKYKNEELNPSDEDGAQIDLTADPTKPTSGLIILLIVIPIVLILLGAFMPLVMPKGSAITGLFQFIGDPGIAMFISTLITMILLRKHLPRASTAVFAAGISAAGPILVILGCAAVYGGVLQATGVGQSIVTLLSGTHLPVLLIACILLVAIHAGTGAGLIAAVTVIPLMQPMFQESGTSLMLVGLLMGVGQLVFLLPTDATFWFTKESCGITESQTAWSMCVPASIVGILGFILILILNTIAPILPGM
jgi:GntP family gluconate:H+ symporter